jgi:hypothetical protein
MLGTKRTGILKFFTLSISKITGIPSGKKHTPKFANAYIS